MNTPEPTTDELRAAFNRATGLRFRGWTFDKACAVPVILVCLRHAAVARRQSQNLPAQPRLF